MDLIESSNEGNVDRNQLYLKSMDEKSLIQRIQSGEKEEFRHLVLSYKDLVFCMIMRQVGNRALSEELSQEVFIKAYTNLAKFKFKSSFSTWLTRIALNHTNTFFTSKRYKMEMITDEFKISKHEQTQVSSRENEENEIEHERMLRCFRLAVSGLKQKFRDVIVLCSLEGKSYEEAAEVLDIPIGTVRSRLNSARLMIKNSLEVA